MCWTFCNTYKYKITMLYTWNYYNALCQLYLKNKQSSVGDRPRTSGYLSRKTICSIHVLSCLLMPHASGKAGGNPASCQHPTAANDHYWLIIALCSKSRRGMARRSERTSHTQSPLKTFSPSWWWRRQSFRFSMSLELWPSRTEFSNHKSTESYGIL